MAKRKSLSPAQVAKLRRALVAGLAERHIDAAANFERSAFPGGFRVIVTSRDFRRLSFGERLDIIWFVLNERWPREDLLRVTMVLGLSDLEVRGGLDAERPPTPKRGPVRRKRSAVLR
jgi:hypothetical protein